ncbi:MAG: adenylate/guanylate cyclase domain-containing protein [Gammaproteobacteria bacterium]|nr:MAG: adenylate/guanylate cyclase domain-containing protein [Gammaproteobacteria bacterium]
MDFSKLLVVVTWLLEREQRVSHRFLKREFGLDQELLEDLCFELVRTRRVATQEDGGILIWTGDDGTPPAAASSDAVSVKARAPPGGSTQTGHENSNAPAQPAPSRSSLSKPTEPTRCDAERRQLTVMFCDLVGSTALSTSLDPEDLREIISAFQNRCREAIQRYQGFIARYMGDGILVYFGYPRAHEEDAERATRAGLEIVRSMAALNAEVGNAHGLELGVRVGVTTGPVVVGDIIGEGAAEEAAVVGETPNLAARLQGVAQPNQLVIGPVTRRLVGELFELEDGGMHELKGIPEPVRVWRVVAEHEVESRFEAGHVGGGLPLVGRQEELGLLVRSWEASKEGHGQVVLIQGEAGIGKSRLLEALRAHVSGQDYAWVAIRCSPYHANSSLYPVIEHLKRVFGWRPEDTPTVRLVRLEKALEDQSLPAHEAVPLYAELLSLSLPEGRYPPLVLSSQQKREQTLDALSGWLLEMAERTPVLQVWEDLHWADPTTLELLALYIEQSPTVSMLNVLAYRPEFVPAWSMRSHMTPITLNRLERAEVEALIGYQANGKAVPSEVIEHIVAKADGVPLYVEELTKTILGSEFLHEEGDRYTLAGSLSDLAIPETLQDSLMARLDRVPTVREIAQLGSVLGREFAYEMLHSLAPHDELVLQDGLDQLVDNELLYQRGRGRRARYVFKHALIQDAAYQSLLKRTRQQYHHHVAELLKDNLPDTAEAQPELLAHHYSEAGYHELAAKYSRAAGRRAAERSANAESIVHLRQGLESIRMLPETSDRTRMELEFLTDLGPALIATMGYGAREVKETYTRAKELCDRVGEKRDRFPVLRGLWNSYLFAAEMGEAHARGEELMGLAEDIGDSGLVVEAHRVMGTVSFMMGDFESARSHMERGIDVYDPEIHGDLAYVYGAHPSVVCRLYAAKALWMLGYPVTAHAMMDKALSDVEALSHGHTQAFALCYQATLAQYERDVPLVREITEATIAVATEHNIRQWLSIGTILSGWALAIGGEGDHGLARLQEGLAGWRQEDLLFVPYFLGLEAEVLDIIERTSEGIDILTKAIALSEQGNQKFCLAELHRLQGTLLLRENRTEDAENSLKRALDVARQQKAKSLELRAGICLARIWINSGKEKQADEMLTEVHDWFTEGIESFDLKEAENLLRESAA